VIVELAGRKRRHSGHLKDMAMVPFKAAEQHETQSLRDSLFAGKLLSF
jgi:hypothetical protein